jgi:hypothetical protein
MNSYSQRCTAPARWTISSRKQTIPAVACFMHRGDVPATLGDSMSRSRVLPWIFVAFGPWIAAAAAANALASSDLSVANLSVVVDGRTVALDDLWTLEAFASTNDTLGGSDSDFDATSSPGSSTAAALIALASASAGAAAAGDPADFAVSGQAASGAHVPACNGTAAFASAFGQLSNFFTISGSGQVETAFAADIVGTLSASADACAIEAATETIFTLQVDGGPPVLFDHHIVAVGMSQSQADAFTLHLTGTLPLTAGVSHFLLLNADSESRALAFVSEPATPLALVAAMVALGWVRRSRVRAPHN